MTEAFGRPVEGEVNRYSEGTPEQGDPADFLAALDALLAAPGVQSVRWTQYTPYFNDGEACVFSASDPGVRLEGTPENAGEYENGYLNDWDFRYKGKGISGNYEALDEDRAVYDPLRRLTEEMNSGRHNVILNQKFGDPSEVTATTEGFSVEFWEHD